MSVWWACGWVGLCGGCVDDVLKDEFVVTADEMKQRCVRGLSFSNQQNKYLSKSMDPN